MRPTDAHRRRAEALTEAPHLPGPDPTTAGYLAAVEATEPDGGLGGTPLYGIRDSGRACVVTYPAAKVSPEGDPAPDAVRALGDGSHVVILHASDGTVSTFAALSPEEARSVAYGLLVIADEAEGL